MYLFDLQLFVTCLDKHSKEEIPQLFSYAGWILFFVTIYYGWKLTVKERHK